ncbi:MAG: MFS transporter [Fimbriimonadaceae bacterium]|nr:MFS transporter [Fimbriimonadaceae bacterium]
MDKSTAASTEQRPLSRLRTLQGMRFWNYSGGFTAVHGAITNGAPVTGFALSFGASEKLIGFLSAAPMLAQALQIIAPLWLSRLRRRKPFCIGAFLTSYSSWLLVALIPWMLPPAWRIWGMIGLVFAAACTAAMAAPASSSWLTDLVPQEIRGRFIARQQAIASTVGFLAGLGAGRFLDQFPEGHQEAGFIGLFAVAVLAAMAGMFMWMAVPEPPAPPPAEGFDPQRLLLPLRHSNFCNLTIFVAGRTGAVFMAAPFFSVFMLKSLKIPYTQIAVFFSAATIFGILSNPFWGYLADKFGYKPLLRISSFGIALNPLPWFFTTQDNYLWLIPLSQVWGGIMGSGLFLSQFNLMLKIAPAENRSFYIGYYNAVASLGAALGSVLGGLLAKALENLGPLDYLGHPLSHLQVLFLVSAFWRMLGIQTLRKVRETDEVPARVLMRQVRSGNPLRTWWNLFRLQRSPDADTKLRATRGLADSGSPLAVDELITALGDSSREVRREATRGLGQLGDERGTWPLVYAVLDPQSDIVEEAVEALGKIASSRSVPAMIELLADDRPTVRKAVVLALGRIGDLEAMEPLEDLLEVERDPTVFVAACEALSQIGDMRALHRLRRMLRRHTTELPRRQLANSIGNLLGAGSDFYRLLETEPMGQDGQVAAMLRRSRRKLARRVLPTTDRTPLAEQLDLGLAQFEQRAYGAFVYHLRQAAARALRSYLAGVGPDLTGRPEQQVHQLLETNDRLRTNFGFLSGLVRDGRDGLHREEALLGVFALEQLADELSRLASNGPV